MPLPLTFLVTLPISLLSKVGERYFVLLSLYIILFKTVKGLTWPGGLLRLVFCTVCNPHANTEWLVVKLSTIWASEDSDHFLKHSHNHNDYFLHFNKTSQKQAKKSYCRDRTSLSSKNTVCVLSICKGIWIPNDEFNYLKAVTNSLFPFHLLVIYREKRPFLSLLFPYLRGNEVLSSIHVSDLFSSEKYLLCLS